MKRSAVLYLILIIGIILSSCSAYNQQVKCPTPENARMNYARNYHKKDFRISKKSLNSAYRSFYKKNTPNSNGKNSIIEKKVTIQPLSVKSPDFVDPAKGDIVSISGLAYKRNSVEQVNNGELSSNKTGNKGSIITSREFRKEIKANIKSIKKEYREIHKSLSSGPKATGFSIASFVLGIVGLIVFGIPCGILAIVFGAIAMARYKKNPGEKLRGFAIAGLILGIIDIIGAIIVLAK